MGEGSRLAWQWLLLLAVALVSGCHTDRAARLQRYHYAELHMATMFQMTFYAPDQARADQAAEAAFQKVADLETIMTDYDPQSELMRLSGAAPGQPMQVSPDLFAVLQKSQSFARKTEGAFDVTVGPLIQLWRAARKNRSLPTADQIAAAQRAVGFSKLQLDAKTRTAVLTAHGMRLDLGGIGKGWAADQALRSLRSQGLRRALVAAGGDIAIGDPPPGQRGWTIGIQSIDHPEEGMTGRILLRNSGISTSGDTEQYVELGGQRYSHIVNPQTGLGLTNRIGVTIVARSATTTDALSTALSVLGARRGLQLVEAWPGVAALVVQIQEGRKTVTPSRRFKNLRPAP